MIVVCSPTELLELSGSIIGFTTLIVAVFVTTPGVRPAVTVTVIAGAAPLGKSGPATAVRLQVTTPAASPQVQPVPVAETNVEPAGSVLVTVSGRSVPE